MDIFYSKNKKALLVVQPFVSRGSLKDQIYNVDNLLKPYDVKYCHEKARPLSFDEIAKFSRQILEALAGLRSKGIVYDHLSATNVVIDDGNARLTELYLPLLAIDRCKDSRGLTESLEQHMDIDVLLFGQILYEMATGTELLAPQPLKSVLKTLAPEIAEVLDAIFYTYDLLSLPEGDVRLDCESQSVEVDDCTSVSTRNGRRDKKHLFLVDVDKMVTSFSLFTSTRDVPPIKTLFAGFRLDSSMKSTIKHSMRINASRTHAHLVHYYEKQTLLRARQRAERRVYEEKEKQQQRVQQLTHRQNSTDKGNSLGSRPIQSRRKPYRADRSRTHAQYSHWTS